MGHVFYSIVIVITYPTVLLNMHGLFLLDPLFVVVRVLSLILRIVIKSGCPFDRAHNGHFFDVHCVFCVLWYCSAPPRIVGMGL